MRRKEKQITDQEQIEQILKQARVCRIAMVDGAVPYVVPVNFGYKDGILYFHSAKAGRKIEILKQNPKVCVEVDELIRLKKAKNACDWGAAFQSVIASGTAFFCETDEEKIQGLNTIMTQYSNRVFAYPDEMLNQTTVIKIVLEEISGKQG